MIRKKGDQIKARIAGLEIPATIDRLDRDGYYQVRVEGCVGTTPVHESDVLVAGDWEQVNGSYSWLLKTQQGEPQAAILNLNGRYVGFTMLSGSLKDGQGNHEYFNSLAEAQKAAENQITREGGKVVWAL